jgi:hypothetical protein
MIVGIEAEGVMPRRAAYRRLIRPRMILLIDSDRGDRVIPEIVYV